MKLSPKVDGISERMQELGLGFMAAGLESFLADKARTELPLVDTLSELFDLEFLPRQERMARTRLKLSGMPQAKRLEDFDLAWLKGGLTEKRFAELASLSFIPRKENIILMGPSGVGKTHLLLGLGRKACMSGFSAYYMSCQDMVEVLTRSRKQNSLKRKLGWLRKPNVLLLDEIGYENLSSEQATLFFQLVATRYEQGSIVMTTNKSFGKWGELMSEDAVATATLDRLLHHAHVFSLKGDSYRMKDRMKAGVVDFG